jgi:phenazine biosynthesis protein phzE
MSRHCDSSDETPCATAETMHTSAPSSTLVPGFTSVAKAALNRMLAPTPPPFAVLHRPHVDPERVEILFGDLTEVATLSDLPEPRSVSRNPAGARAEGAAEAIGAVANSAVANSAEENGGTAAPDCLPVLAVVPFRQIRERGFDAIDDHAPLLALAAQERIVVSRAELLALLPSGPESFTETGYDVGDEEYEDIVRAVLEQEIATGAGSNFVIHRCLTGQFDVERESPARAALGALGSLLTRETNAYWTFVVHTPERTFVGATPERHVSLDAGIARMNPISGTLRYPIDGWANEVARRHAVLSFLADAKERDELAMVVDEELKMMAVVGDRGGRIAGPYLKEMAHLAHTEYVIEGRTSFDVRDVLTATMFAPTVTGSPIRNACRVIARHEQRGRGYYGGVLALIGTDADGGQSLDAPILIRTAQIAADGSVKVAAGATLVRGSQPVSELAETRAKAAGIVSALTATTPDRPRAVGSTVHGLADGPGVQEKLAERNRTMAKFWLQEQTPGLAGAAEPGGQADPVSVAAGELRRVTVINAEDDFTGMLAQLLRAVGFAVDVHPWEDLTGPAGEHIAQAELVVLGPGPGDPGDLADPRILALRTLAKVRLAAGQPVLGVCLGHQILAQALGLRVTRLDRPDQGKQSVLNLFGSVRRVGFYNSYVVQAPSEPESNHATPGLTFSLDHTRTRVQAIRGAGLASFQFHPESVLTLDGPEILEAELRRLYPSHR